MKLEVTMPDGTVHVVDIELNGGQTIREGETLLLKAEDDGTIGVLRELGQPT